ncbi:U6 snRNA-associated Sm-like protein LSm3 [Portunus trituberculatus]|uniref:U6 snRNA-associated Sm-like protein LSm3 n=1 Tax=Portunus trituberculatus TaxID=210409 RepID=A0A5B7F3Y6_PORTR|nr:U6 snRNA-associated Sm-like protein LSm3 [Portunus trituberculatus]
MFHHCTAGIPQHSRTQSTLLEEQDYSCSCLLYVDDETFEEVYKTTRRNIPMLFVRGDGVILVAPPMRGGGM